MRTWPSPYEEYIRFDELKVAWPTGSAEDLAFVCGFQSVETLALLSRYAADDPRPYSDRERRRERIREVSACVVRTVGELLSGAGPRAALTVRSSKETLLAELGESTLFRAAFDSAFGAGKYRLGVESAVFSGQPDTEPNPPYVDYDRLVRPATTHGLLARARLDHEDPLFRGVHQMVECWLALTTEHVRSAGRHSETHWSRTSQNWSWATRSLETAGALMSLLEEMVLADYHRLRVMLRDGSGAQSPQASALPGLARESAARLFEAVGGDPGLVAILHAPTTDECAYQAVNRAGSFAHAYQRFLFHHYQLASGVLGTGGTGSLGYGLGALARRAAEPLFPELDRVRARVAAITDIQYDHLSGVAFADSSPAGETKSVDAMPCAPWLMRETVERMFRALRERDREAWVGSFAARQGRYRSSPCTRPYIGRAALGVYIDKVFRLCAELTPRFTFHPSKPNRAEVTWTCDITTEDGTVLVAEGRSDLSFTSEGKVAEATSLWNHGAVAAELLRATHPDVSAAGTRTDEQRSA